MTPGLSPLRDLQTLLKVTRNERDDSKDSAYWEALSTVIPDARLSLWDTLYTALERYQ